MESSLSTPNYSETDDTSLSAICSMATSCNCADNADTCQCMVNYEGQEFSIICPNN